MGDLRRIGPRSVLASLGEDRTVTSAGAAPGPVEGDATIGAGFHGSAERYDVEAHLGAGGMGEVLLVTDRDLRRPVAMKVLAAGGAASPAQRLMFVAEAQATSQLDHPGIPPVHDLGLTPRGELFFTMKLVRGRNLRECLRDLLVGMRHARGEFTLHRLVTILERVSEAVHFAHEKGVIHRDLKPENIMLGEFGEVHVMDWGIAKIAGIDDPAGGEEVNVSTGGTEAGLRTRDGVLKGTPPYMSPEQAAGLVSQLDRRSDVYALGCILYEMLTLYPALQGSDVLGRVCRGEFPPVETRNPKREVPSTLAATCRRAMALAPADRHATAREFAGELRGWLDGTRDRSRRHEEAEGLARRGKEAADRYEALRREVEHGEAALDGERERHPPWESVEEKRPLHEARRRVEASRRASVLAFAETTRLLEGALLAEEGNATARGLLARLWQRRLLDAEARGDGDDAAYALAMVRRYDDGALAPFLRGDGALELRSEPTGARVRIHPFETRDEVLVPGEPMDLGTTPVGPVRLPMGSWLCTLDVAGRPPVVYPVRIGRGGTWRGSVRIPVAAEYGEGFVLVPAGPFACGEGRDARTVDLPDFLIARDPVTFGEYAAFLTAVEREEGLEAALARRPRTPGDGPLMGREADGTWRPLPSNCEGPTRERWIPRLGDSLDERLPVAGVTYDDAEAYCAWKSRETGTPWRLPTAEEREKAARGVDGRTFPWGETADPALARCRDSRPESCQPEPVDCFPTATSVYGMRDAAGNSFDWTSTWADAANTLRVMKGGSWLSEMHLLRCAAVHRRQPEGRFGFAGFRAARDPG